MTDETTRGAEIDDQVEYLDPDKNGIIDPTTTRLVQLAEEIGRLRASARHWRERALKAEPLAARAEDLQKRLNAKLADESAEQLANGHPGKPKVEAKP